MEGLFLDLFPTERGVHCHERALYFKLDFFFVLICKKEIKIYR